MDWLVPALHGEPVMVFQPAGLVGPAVPAFATNKMITSPEALPVGNVGVKLAPDAIVLLVAVRAAIAMALTRPYAMLKMGVDESQLAPAESLPILSDCPSAKVIAPKSHQPITGRVDVVPPVLSYNTA